MNALLIGPFSDYVFMQRALVGSLAVCLGAVPVGIFMTLRQMSLTGDAMAHAILPGAAIAYLLSGLSLVALTLGGLVAGLVVAALAGWVARSTHLKEDTSSSELPAVRRCASSTSQVTSSRTYRTVSGASSSKCLTLVIAASRPYRPGSPNSRWWRWTSPGTAPFPRYRRRFRR